MKVEACADNAHLWINLDPSCCPTILCAIHCLGF